jgi:phosphate starvation-inducible protein PhoH and related proteins
LPRGTYSGLKHAIDVLSEVDALSFNYFVAKDVVRHPVVQKIVIAYEAFEAAAAAKKQAEKEAALQALAAQSNVSAVPEVAAVKSTSRGKTVTKSADTETP